MILLTRFCIVENLAINYNSKNNIIVLMNKGLNNLSFKQTFKRTYKNRKMETIISEFPTAALLPKKETGAASFITKYPEYDGRGVVIAIMDSGVDPGASGLQVTSDGKPKIIGRYDCSGAGDVATSTVVQSVNGEIQGLTGRTLKVPNAWKNPSGNYHIGVINAFHIYPKTLQDRLIKEKKEKLWNPIHKTEVGIATRNLDNIVKDHEANKLITLTREQKLTKDEAEAQLDVLNMLEKKYNDVGAVYDCIVFHDGEMWRACLDTSEKGDLESCKLLGEYTLTLDYATTSPSECFNYSINVHDEGNLLEVVGCSSIHGTHVSSIAAANFPENPERNGIAPGAQIVSLTIGDSRLGTMETGSAFARAMIHIMKTNRGTEQKIDLINMSYGEHSHFNAGHLEELMAEVVDKYGVVWVASAGNHGPALSTITTPPNAVVPNFIGVGAYVSPEMMQIEYSLRQKLPGMPYTWSSRGPCMDGEKGVSICAPGAAITSVSNYTLRGSQLLNGTSMAAPHACGCIALLLSGLKAQNLPYSPFSVKRAVENTALYLDSMDPFAQGHGLLQVENAFENLVNFHDAPERDVRFNVACGLAKKKGIYIRCDIPKTPKEFFVTIEPIFTDTDNYPAEKKIKFQMSLVLVCNAPWVKCPTHLEMMNAERTISVCVDPAGLSHGVHQTCIRAYDAKEPKRGPVFRIEVTLVQPQELNNLQSELSFVGEYFEPNTIKRHFILVPDQATWAVVKLETQEDTTGKFEVCCMQLLPNKNCNTMSVHRMLNVRPHSEPTLAFKVQGGVILEVVVAKYWANFGSMKLNYKIVFGGCKSDTPVVSMFQANGIHCIQVQSGLHTEELSPTIQIKSMESVLKPTEAKVQALSERDVIPPGRYVYQLLLTYTFHLNKCFDVTPYNALLYDMLYESEFQSQLWMLFDCNKQLLATGDTVMGKYKYNCKLEKGDYTIIHQIRHDKKELLEKLVELPFMISYKLANPIPVDIYRSQTQALIGGKKLTTFMTSPGKRTYPIYIAPIPTEKYQKVGVQGQYFSGTITYSKDEFGKKVDTYPFLYILSDTGKKSQQKTPNNKTKQEEYVEALRDLQVSWLPKLESTEAADKLYDSLCADYSEHLPIHTAMLAYLEPEAKRQWPGSQSNPVDPATLSRMIAIANKVISSVDANELLIYMGTKNDQRPDAQKIKQNMDRQKTALIDALSRLGSAQSRLFSLFPDADSGTPKPTLEDVDKTYMEMLRFSENNNNSEKVTGHFTVWHAHAHKHYGRMLKALYKLQEEKPSKDIDEAIIWAMTQLGWQHSASMISSSLPARYPQSYRLF